MTYSQYKQDFFVDFLLNRKTNGVFVDIGAHNGISFSNSYFFEKQRNWTGICIEPNPAVFEKLKTNRNCTLQNCCIAEKEGDVKFRQVHGGAQMLSGILGFFDEEHIQRIEREIKHNSGGYEDIIVKCKNINSILDETGIKQIDFCSIDTEGAEFEIIKSIDFEKIHIDVFSIEKNNKNVATFLLTKGYKCIDSMLDNFYVKNKLTGWRFYLLKIFCPCYKIVMKSIGRLKQVLCNGFLTK